MKEGIFISYSDFDKDKVDLIVNELEGNTKFFPIVIASNREALKPLAEKVADGIIQAKVILPILTKNSIPTQWINQEIGFATALNKRIMPIVENDLIDKLKGFIHKQIDLPYNYQPNSNKASEHKDFIKQFRNLLADLEVEFQKLVTADELPLKSDFEKSLEKVDTINTELEYKRQLSLFLDSREGADAANTEVLRMFSDIESKIEILKEKNYYFNFERNISNQPKFILKAEGFSVSIVWARYSINSCEGSILYVRKWNGHLTIENDAHYFPGEVPKRISDDQYLFDRNYDNELCWINKRDNKQYKSEKISDSCISWLLDEVSKVRLKNIK